MRRWLAIALIGVGYGLARMAEWLSPSRRETVTVFFSSAARRRHERQQAKTKPAPDPAAEPASTPKENP